MTILLLNSKFASEYESSGGLQLGQHRQATVPGGTKDFQIDVEFKLPRVGTDDIPCPTPRAFVDAQGLWGLSFQHVSTLPSSGKNTFVPVTIPFRFISLSTPAVDAKARETLLPFPSPTFRRTSGSQ
jgi:hypothetical protein